MQGSETLYSRFVFWKYVCSLNLGPSFCTRSSRVGIFERVFISNLKVLPEFAVYTNVNIFKLGCTCKYYVVNSQNLNYHVNNNLPVVLFIWTDVILCKFIIIINR